jgi:hypothetical protein
MSAEKMTPEQIAEDLGQRVLYAIVDAEAAVRAEAARFMRTALHEFDHIVHSLEILGPSMALHDAKRGQQILREGLEAFGVGAQDSA